VESTARLIGYLAHCRSADKILCYSNDNYRVIVLPLSVSTQISFGDLLFNIQQHFRHINKNEAKPCKLNFVELYLQFMHDRLDTFHVKCSQQKL